MANLTEQQLVGMGFSLEAIRAASRREYSTEGEIIDACHREQMRLSEQITPVCDMDALEWLDKMLIGLRKEIVDKAATSGDEVTVEAMKAAAASVITGRLVAAL